MHARALSGGGLAVLWVAIAIGCGADATDSGPEPATPAPDEAPADETPAPEPAPVSEQATPSPVEAEPIPELPEVDLLHAAHARVAVSSAYRDDAEQVGRMVDGDLASAWNSRTGDLVGAWIEVEVPAEATVRAVALTPGFVRRSATGDLFTGNHRIARVRVSTFDGGAPNTVGESPLDVEARDLVEVPVGRPGGRLRIEVLETRPGTREDWREICVSELRVLGTLASAAPGTSTPVTSVGALGPAPTLDDDAEAAAEAARDAAEDAELAALDRELALDSVSSLIDDWDLYAGRIIPTIDGARVSERQRAERQEHLARRARVFAQAAELVAETDPAQAARLRERASSGGDLWEDLGPDLDAILGAGETVLGPIAEHACAWARLRALARLRQYACVVDTSTFTIEGLIEDGRDLDGFPLRADGRAQLRQELTEVRAINEAVGRMNVDGLETVSNALRRRLSDMSAPTSSWVTGPWTALRTELDRVGRACAP